MTAKTNPVHIKIWLSNLLVAVFNSYAYDGVYLNFVNMSTTKVGNS